VTDLGPLAAGVSECRCTDPADLVYRDNRLARLLLAGVVLALGNGLAWAILCV
jgi:hypothetical protein